MDARCYNKLAENLMNNEQGYCAATQVQRDLIERKGYESKHCHPKQHFYSAFIVVEIKQRKESKTHSPHTHTHTHFFMNFSKPNYTLVLTTMYRYGLKPCGFIFFYSKPHTYKCHTHTHKFFLFFDQNHSHLFMLPTICLALALVEKTWFI